MLFFTYFLSNNKFYLFILNTALLPRYSPLSYFPLLTSFFDTKTIIFFINHTLYTLVSLFHIKIYNSSIFTEKYNFSKFGDVNEYIYFGIKCAINTQKTRVLFFIRDNI